MQTPDDKPPRRRAGGRHAKAALRAAKPLINPCPPGPVGGRYKPLTDPDMDAIYRAALDLLADLGIGEVPEKVAEPLLRAGATRGDDGRFRCSNSMVEDMIALAAKRFILHARDDARSIDVGGERVHFGTGGAAVQALDVNDGRYRSSTLRDLHQFTALQDRLDNVSWFSRCCVATDLADPFELDVNTAYALMLRTEKHVGTSFTLAEHVAPIVDMFDLVAGGEGRFAKRPFVKAHVTVVISPMRYGADAVDVICECVRFGIPISCITAAQSGATAPATLAGFLAQSLAETLAGLILINALSPGFPVVFSNWPFAVDLRTGSFSGGGGEVGLMNAASAQLSNRLGLPSGVATSMTDAKALDSQHGAEKAYTALAAALAGGNLIYESSGMTASLLGASLEAFLLDNEMHSALYRIVRGIEVSDETIDVEGIKASVLGDGHFLGAAATRAAMETEYFYPVLADRDPPRTWHENGSLDAWARSKARVREILSEPPPRRINDDVDSRLRSSLPIHPIDSLEL